MSIDINRHANSVAVPGSEAAWKIGPFEFYVRTSDGYQLGFSITVRGHVLDWGIGHEITEREIK